MANIINYTISREWYESIKDVAPMADPFFYVDKVLGEQVEVDILDENTFVRVSKNLGWMI